MYPDIPCLFCYSLLKLLNIFKSETVVGYSKVVITPTTYNLKISSFTNNKEHVS